MYDAKKVYIQISHFEMELKLSLSPFRALPLPPSYPPPSLPIVTLILTEGGTKPSNGKFKELLIDISSLSPLLGSKKLRSLIVSLPSLQLVELKNGETYNGHLVNCDNWMNIQLREVICTSRVSI